MQSKITKKIIIDQYKLETLFRLKCPQKLIINLLKTGKFTPTGDSLIDYNLESLIDYKTFNNNNWGGKREGAGRPKNNKLKNQDEYQDEYQNTNQDVDKDKDKYIYNNINNNNNILSGIRDKRFIPPTEQEVLDYAKQMHEVREIYGFYCSKSMAESFYGHYASQNWIIGNGIPMWDWKKKLKEWSLKQQKIDNQKEL